MDDDLKGTRGEKCVARRHAGMLLTLCIAVYAKQPLQAMYFKSLLHRGDRYYVLWRYASEPW